MASVQSSEDGAFVQQLYTINGPTRGSYIIRMEGKCTKAWWVDYGVTPPAVLRWDPVAEVFRVPDAGTHAEVVPISGEDSVDKVTLYWNDNTSCSLADVEATKADHPLDHPRLNSVLLGYSIVFSRSLGVSYHRTLSLGGARLFSMQAALGLWGTSYALGVLAFFRVPIYEGLSLFYGGGPLWTNVFALDALGGPYHGDVRGLQALVQAGMAYSFKFGLHAEAGYAGTTLGDGTDGRFFVQAGWDF